MYDLLIKNGIVLDGTGGASYTADVAVVGGEIVALGKLEGEAQKTIDAGGLAVSPGFIDLHTHSDMSFLLDSTAQSKVRQGVTLELTGNCGMSLCAPLHGDAEALLLTKLSQYASSFDITWNDFAGYLDALQNAGSTLNIATQVGHHTVRACVVGLEDKTPSPDDLDRMKGLVAESLDAGALGFSTGLYYAPGNYARPEEVMHLAVAAAERDKLYSTHLRDEGTANVGLFPAINEAIEVARRTGVRLEVSHVKCQGPSFYGRADQLLDHLDRAIAEGIDVAGDQYPYTAGSTSLTGAVFPRWSLEGGRKATLKRMAEPGTRRRMLENIDTLYPEEGGPEGIVVARFAPDPHYEGMAMARIAEEMGCSPAEAALRLFEKSDADCVSHFMVDADVDLIARHPQISVASDGSSLSAEGVLSVGRPHPRSYGTNPRFLARFVRERQLVTLEDAIRKMTSLPAERLGLTRRGRIAPGYAADLVVFDPDSVAETGTYEAPHSYPTGIPHVAVNGVMVVEDGQFTGQTPGVVIRGFED